VIIKFKLGFLCHELSFILFRERLFNQPASQPRVHLKEDDDQSDDVRLHSCLPLPASHWLHPFLSECRERGKELLRFRNGQPNVCLVLCDHLDYLPIAACCSLLAMTLIPTY